MKIIEEIDKYKRNLSLLFGARQFVVCRRCHCRMGEFSRTY